MGSQTKKSTFVGFLVCSWDEFEPDSPEGRFDLRGRAQLLAASTPQEVTIRPREPSIDILLFLCYHRIMFEGHYSKEKKFVRRSTAIAAGLLGLVTLSGCNEEIHESSNRTPLFIEAHEDGTYHTKVESDGGDTTEIVLRCSGDALVYDQPEKLSQDSKDTYLDDYACEDGKLTEDEVKDFILGEVVHLTSD